MTTSTRRVRASFPVEAGVDRRGLIKAFDDATFEIQRSTSGEVLWDMLRVEYQEEEREEITSLAGEEIGGAVIPSRITLSVPVVETT